MLFTFKCTDFPQPNTFLYHFSAQTGKYIFINKCLDYPAFSPQKRCFFIFSALKKFFQCAVYFFSLHCLFSTSRFFLLKPRLKYIKYVNIRT